MILYHPYLSLGRLIIKIISNPTRHKLRPTKISFELKLILVFFLIYLFTYFLLGIAFLEEVVDEEALEDDELRFEDD